jgi:hypothetical protein
MVIIDDAHICFIPKSKIPLCPTNIKPVIREKINPIRMGLYSFEGNFLLANNFASLRNT